MAIRIAGPVSDGRRDVDRRLAVVEITYEWRGEFENAEVNALHAEGFGHPVSGAGA
jgi:hypothetical protein